MPKAAAAAVGCIREYNAEAEAGTQDAIELGKSDLGLGPVPPQRLRDACLGKAGGVIGPDLR
jgi:hypothetical protein